MDNYILPSDVEQENPRIYNYNELQALYPRLSVPTVGDFYSVRNSDPEDEDSEVIIELAFYKIDYGASPEGIPGYDVSVAGYEIKPVSDENGGVAAVFQQKPKPFEELAGSLKNSVTTHRKFLETAGITVNGNPVQTSVEDQNRITSVLVNANRAGIQTIRFKTATNGFVSITISALENIANAIALQVQAWFNAEEAHYSAIDALVADSDFEALVAYDHLGNWPSSNLVI